MYRIYDVIYLVFQKIHAKLEIFLFYTYYCLPFVTKKVIEDKAARIIFSERHRGFYITLR